MQINHLRACQREVELMGAPFTPHWFLPLPRRLGQIGFPQQTVTTQQTPVQSREALTSREAQHLTGLAVEPARLAQLVPEPKPVSGGLKPFQEFPVNSLTLKNGVVRAVEILPPFGSQPAAVLEFRIKTCPRVRRRDAELY